MIRYILDTNAVIALLTKRSTSLESKVFGCAEGAIGLSAIVAHELYFGAYKSQRVSFNLETLRLLFADFTIIEFDQEDSRVAGEIRGELASTGMPIGPYDVLIAGQVKARGLVLITNNVGEFKRVTNLQIEDWTQS